MKIKTQLVKKGKNKNTKYNNIMKIYILNIYKK